MERNEIMKNIITKDKSFYNQFFSMYFILVLHNVIALSVNLADNIMIGSYSETALAGVAAVNQVQYVFHQILLGVGNALVVIGSQYWGQGRCNEIKRTSVGALIIGMSAALVIFVFAAVSPEGMIRIFSPSEPIIKAGSEYIKLIKYTYIIFALTSILLSSLRSVETVRIGFYVSMVTLVINCCINFVLISGRFGAPELGVTGAAIGTLTARIIELIMVVCYVAFADKKLRIRIGDVFAYDKILVKDYFKVSFSIILVAAMFGLSTALQSVILGHMSDSAIAANSMAGSLFQVLKIMSVAAASASAVIIGKTIGSDHMKKLKEYVCTLQFIFLCIGTVTSISLFLLRKPILSLYNLTEETKVLANGFLLVLCATGFGTAYQMPALIGIVQGGGDGKFILKNDIISIWCIVLPMSFLAAFVFKWHPVAVVFCLNSDQIFKCVAAAIKVTSYTWIKKLRR